jgi:glutamate carboxypeptidase
VGDGTQRLAHLRARRDEMVETLSLLVEAESPSTDLERLDICAELVSSVGADVTGCPAQVVRVDGRPHLEWRFGATTRVALIGHFDTVWPVGTIARKPFTLSGDVITGPGSLDMKAGIVQLFAALGTLSTLDGMTIVLTSDEELGSQTSRAMVEAAARGALAALVLEPTGDGGALKTARKGTGMYTMTVGGRAAHAGLEPEKGANALIELAHLVLAVDAVARPELGTTVTPTVAQAGTATNVVPDTATIEIDVRVAVAAEADRVDRDIRALATTVPGCTLTVSGGPNRPPMPASASAPLVPLVEAAAARLGLAPPGGVEVGGASDGNFTAAIGTPTLDGLGAVGEGAHAEREYVVASAMPERAALLAELVDELLAKR